MPTHLPAKERKPIATNPDADLPVFYVNNAETFGSNLDLRFRFGQIQSVEDETVHYKNVVTVYMSLAHARLFSAQLANIVKAMEAFDAPPKAE